MRSRRTQRTSIASPPAATAATTGVSVSAQSRAAITPRRSRTDSVSSITRTRCVAGVSRVGLWRIGVPTSMCVCVCMRMVTLNAHIEFGDSYCGAY